MKKSIKLRLTESLRQFIMEQASRSFILPNQLYPMGIYSINRIDTKLIDDALEQIKVFASKNSGNKVGVQIEAGESKVTNYDREKYPDGGGTPLPEGELARRRGEGLRGYLVTKLGEMVKGGILKEMPEIPEPKIILGKESYKRGVDNPKDPKYLDDQFIKLNFYVSGEGRGDNLALLPTRGGSEVGKCLFDMVVEFRYIHNTRMRKKMDKEEYDGKFFCRGHHICDNAIFQVKLGNVVIGDINFNNQSSTEGKNGENKNKLAKLKTDNYEEYSRLYSRYAKINVTPDKVKEILADPIARQNGYITLRLYCLGDNACHTSGPEVIIKMGGKVVFEQSCVIRESSVKRTKKPIRLLKMGLCGNNIEKILLPIEEQPPFIEGVDS